MLTDLVGFTASTQTDEAGTLRLLQEQEQMVRPMLSAHRGREIKSTGDGFLVEFDSALRAVQCAIAIQQHLKARNAEADVRPIVLRIGVHLGDVEERGGDIFGDAVNVAFRMVPVAPPGGICVSRTVFELVRNKVDERFEPVTEVKLKGVQVAPELYCIASPSGAIRPPVRETSGARLAVLPLMNLGPDASDDYLADGLTEELIGTLSRIDELRVIARTSVGQYKFSSKSIAQIAAELDVGTVLEGSVRKAGNRVRIALQLVDARTQEHLWSNAFDRELTDVLAIQSEVAERTAAALRLDLLTPAREALARRPTVNLAAYTAYLRGIHASRKAADEDHVAALRYLEQAVETDPQFSSAHSYLANEYLGLSGEVLAPAEALPRAKELVGLALALDPNSSEAHVAAGNLAMQRDQDWATAEREFQKAVLLNPSNGDAHYWYAILLMVLRRFEGSKQQLSKAIDLEPLWPLLKQWLARVHLRAGDPEAAILVLEGERDLSPDDPGARIRLGLAYAAAGRRAAARREVEGSPRPERLYEALDWAELWFYLDGPEESRQLVDRLEAESKQRYIPGAVIAMLYARLGDTEKSFDRLERSHQGWDRGLWLEYQSRMFDPVRKDPRFRRMLTRVHVPPET